MASNANEVNALIRAYDEWEKQIRADAFNEFIGNVKEEINELYNWDDDEYENGMKAGYKYSIEIAEQMKEEKK